MSSTKVVQGGGQGVAPGVAAGRSNTQSQLAITPGAAIVQIIPQRAQSSRNHCNDSSARWYPRSRDLDQQRLPHAHTRTAPSRSWRHSHPPHALPHVPRNLLPVPRSGHALELTDQGRQLPALQASQGAGAGGLGGTRGSFPAPKRGSSLAPSVAAPCTASLAGGRARRPGLPGHAVAARNSSWH